ncbi:MAG TPA: uracil-DNA glycosylase [Steroidobacteraceae bacterium]|nr:uracil-DNA glycosylase [Steroidobacteraceae bacterium]
MSRALRKEYLAALGLETWTLRGDAAAAEPVEAPFSEPAQGVGASGAVEAAPAMTAAARGAGRRSDVSPREATTREATSREATPREAQLREAAPREATLREAAYDWPQLRERVAACTRCGLSATRTQTVFGVGNLRAEWLVVGEAPGAEEDRQGEPFVGRAGQLLNAMLRAIGLAREQVYIANVLKCRPPQNRDPVAAETVECLPFLDRQIALLKPKIMLVVGRIAAQNLLRTDAKLGALRQQVHTYGASGVPLIVTYHPAYLLRSPAEKRKAWEDLKFAREVFARG